MTPLLSEIFPKNVKTAEGKPSLITGSLYPEEEAHIINTIQKRQIEFKAGRLLAKKLLNEFGIDRFPIKVADKKMPLWPDGICGSISHTREYCGVAIAKAKDYASIGLDIETLGRIKEKLWPSIFLPQEIAYLNTLPAQERNDFATLIFSAKECFFKMQFPIAHQWLNFHDVLITISTDLRRNIAQNWSATSSSHQIKKSQGKFILTDRFVLTGIVQAPS